MVMGDWGDKGLVEEATGEIFVFLSRCYVLSLNLSEELFV